MSAAIDDPTTEGAHDGAVNGVTATAEADAPTEDAAPAPAPSPAPSRAKVARPAQLDELVAAVRRLEVFASAEAKRVSGKILPQVEAKARDNLWTSLIIALGLGFVLGAWLTSGRRRG